MEKREPYAIVPRDVAEAFGMTNLPNVLVLEAGQNEALRLVRELLEGCGPIRSLGLGGPENAVTIPRIREWRRLAGALGLPSDVLDYFKAFNVCYPCKGRGRVHGAYRTEACQACRGFGREKI